MAEYRFVTLWRLEAPLSEIYEAILHSRHWPGWWQGVEKVEDMAPGDSTGIGNVRCYTLKSRLPYRLVFAAHTVRIEPLVELAAEISGDLEGMGRWLFSVDGRVTTVRHEWRVRTTRLWMNLAAPLGRFLFEWNHHALMEHGALGLARLVNAPLLGVVHADWPDR
ncbi:MAG: SRPBCC family protein [Sulfuricella sp.]|nr:SRPBCC family protein [Sulfuricella sp.]